MPTRATARTALGLAAALIAVVLATNTASADVTAPLYAKMKQRFSTGEPGASTGWSFEGALKSIPEGEQVPPQREIQIVFPRGTQIDPKAVRACRASDGRIAEEGPSACPRRSRVGSGELGLFLGPGAPVVVDVSLLSEGNGVLMVLTAQNGDVVRVIHLSVNRNRVTSTVVPLPLGNGYEAAIISAKLRIDRRGSRERPLIRTPRRCPRSRHWTITYLPRYDEPHGVQRSTSSTPCSGESR